ncbi:MAG: glycoside hydrolase family 38 C-terminal domain-containing protein, partial [Cyanobacteria bacterium P01_H01_bin.119]
HGGGPTRDMLEKARRWAASPFFPTLTFDTAPGFLETIQPPHPSTQLRADSPTPLPHWPNELYLELHRGCYTTHADQKQFNRRCEDLLTQAEIFAAIAQLTTDFTYPKAELEAAWKGALFNQFHDILPGSSIPEVFAVANQAWQRSQDAGERILQAAQGAIASQVPLPESLAPNAVPYIVFNGLNWPRTEVTAVKLPPSPVPGLSWQVLTPSGELISCQQQVSLSIDQPEDQPETLLFLAEGIPSVGYRLYWLVPAPPAETTRETPNDFTLENTRLKVTVDDNTGDLHSLYDKLSGKEVLRASGNQLQAFQDGGQYWDAWNIAPDYAEHPLPQTQLQSIQWIEYGSLRQRLRVVRTLNAGNATSTFTQDYVLDYASPIVRIETTADWQGDQVVLKTAFPVNLQAPRATFETAYGAIARTTQPQTPQEKAQWEVPGIRWADLGDKHYGVSLLSDYKHGYDVQPDQIRLTLLKAPLWPDSGCDRGLHTFTYAIYPHSGTWQQAHTLHRAHGLTVPLRSLYCLEPDLAFLSEDGASAIAPSYSGSSDPVSGQQSYLNLGSRNVILSAFKQAEDDPNCYILRYYEAHGEAATVYLKTALPLGTPEPVNLLEGNLSEFDDCPPDRAIGAYQLRSDRLRFVSK